MRDAPCKISARVLAWLSAQEKDIYIGNQLLLHNLCDDLEPLKNKELMI